MQGILDIMKLVAQQDIYIYINYNIIYIYIYI